MTKSIGLSVLFPRQAPLTNFEKGSIREVRGDSGDEFKLLGLKRDFRFVGLQPYHRVLLAVARELEIPVRLSASIEMSTCTLKYRPHDVSEVENWPEILQATLDFLQSDDQSAVSASSGLESVVNVPLGAADGFAVQEETGRKSAVALRVVSR